MNAKTTLYRSFDRKGNDVLMSVPDDDITPAPRAEQQAANDDDAPADDWCDTSDVEDCPFCHSLSHTDVRDCPNIDAEQLADEVHPGQPCQFDSAENLDGGWCVLCHQRRGEL